MKPEEIKAGKTYEGGEGEYAATRTVVEVVATPPVDIETHTSTPHGIRDVYPAPGRWVLFTSPHGRGRSSLDYFARWAVREVPAGREGGEGKA